MSDRVRQHAREFVLALSTQNECGGDEDEPARKCGAFMEFRLVIPNKFDGIGELAIWGQPADEAVDPGKGLRALQSSRGSPILRGNLCAESLFLLQVVIVDVLDRVLSAQRKRQKRQDCRPHPGGPDALGAAAV